MKRNFKKWIAPIVVTVLLILYFIVYFGFLITLVNGVFKYLLGILPVAFAAIAVCVCVERINEIRSGEEDDLSKY